MTSDGEDGPVAQEAMRLAEAMSSWAKSSARPRSDDGQGPEGESEGTRPCSCADSAAVGTVCGVCPICRVAGIVAAIQPEVIERVADVLTMVAGSLQEVAEDRRRHRDAQPDDQSSADGPTADGPVDE